MWYPIKSVKLSQIFKQELSSKCEKFCISSDLNLFEFSHNQ